MKWIEMIRVRSSPGALEQEIPIFLSRATELRSIQGVADAMVLQHALFSGDIAFVLVWDNERTPSQTREGLMIAGLLQRHGIVDHAVWKAAPGFSIPIDQAGKNAAPSSKEDRTCAPA